MDYEKKYKEALERARELYNDFLEDKNIDEFQHLHLD